MRYRWEGTNVNDGKVMGFYSISFVDTNEDAEITHWSTYVNDEEYGPFLEAAIGARGPFHGDSLHAGAGKAFREARPELLEEPMMTTSSATDKVYYDPWDTDLNANPYPMFRRLRDEAPLYYNEAHDFYAVSRFEDVNRALVDHADVQLGARSGAGNHQGGHRDSVGHC